MGETNQGSTSTSSGNYFVCHGTKKNMGPVVGPQETKRGDSDFFPRAESFSSLITCCVECRVDRFLLFLFQLEVAGNHQMQYLALNFLGGDTTRGNFFSLNIFALVQSISYSILTDNHFHWKPHVCATSSSDSYIHRHSMNHELPELHL